MKKNIKLVEDKGEYTLESLIDEITEKNKHPEIQTGLILGKEKI